MKQYAQYSLSPASASGAAAQTSPAAQGGPAPPVAEDPKADVHVTPQADNQIPIQEGGSFTEEKIEYRDEEGNLLDEEQVKELEGKVSFSTRYETRTRLVDAAGNEVMEEVNVNVAGKDPAGEEVAGTKIEGVEQETVGGEQASGKPPKVPVGQDKVKEKVAESRSLDGEAKPEEDVGKSTKKDEL